jgi:hypothetical protein
MHDRLILGYWQTDPVSGRELRVPGMLEQINETVKTNAAMVTTLKKREEDDLARTKEIKTFAWKIATPIIGGLALLTLIEIARWITAAAPDLFKMVHF